MKMLYFGLWLLNLTNNQAQCRYNAAPIIRDRLTGIVWKQRLYQPKDSSGSEANRLWRRSYLTYSINFSSTPQPSLNLLTPSFVSEVLPSSKMVEPLRACHFMASHITRLLPRK